MQYLKVKNLEHYQHYKDRDPKWIKLYYSILDDETFMVLSEVERCRYMTCLIIASRTENKIPHDPVYLKKVMRLDKAPDLSRLISLGFLLPYDSSSICLDSDKHLSQATNHSLLSSSLLSSPNSPNPDLKIQSNGHAKDKRVLRAISDDDKPTEKHIQFGQSLGIDVGPEWGKFKNYCLAHDKRYANFEAAFRNWLANANQMKGASR